jgi:hypothetical protein
VTPHPVIFQKAQTLKRSVNIVFEAVIYMPADILSRMFTGKWRYKILIEPVKLKVFLLVETFYNKSV